MIFKKFAFAAATLTVCFLTVLLLLYEPYTSEAIRDTLVLFINRVLPPLFPYMVLSKLIVSRDLLSPVSRILRTDRLFRLPSRASSVIFTGLLCGFPIGAAGTCTLYEDGFLSKNAAGRLAALSSNTSPAFLLGTVAALWNSKLYGGFLFAVQTVSAAIIAWILARMMREDSDHAENTAENPPRKTDRFSGELCKAVSESASSCLTVCAYIVFFRVIAVLLSHLLPFAAPVASVLLEFSSGCADGAAVGGSAGLFMTGCAVGTAGLSVMMQNYNLLGPCGIPMKALWITKGIQGLVCGTASVLFFREIPLKSVGTAVVFGECFSLNAVVLTLSVLLLLSKLYKISKHMI